MTSKSLIKFREWCKGAVKSLSKWGFQRNIKLHSECMKHVEAIERIENIKFDRSPITINTFKGYIYVKLRLEFIKPKADKDYDSRSNPERYAQERTFNMTKYSIFESYAVSEQTSRGVTNWYPMRPMKDCEVLRHLRKIFDIFSKSKYIKTRFEEYNKLENPSFKKFKDVLDDDNLAISDDE